MIKMCKNCFIYIELLYYSVFHCLSEDSLIYYYKWYINVSFDMFKHMCLNDIRSALVRTVGNLYLFNITSLCRKLCSNISLTFSYVKVRNNYLNSLFSIVHTSNYGKISFCILIQLIVYACMFV